MILIALATLISEDLACIGAGLMAARGTIGLIPAVVASFLGIFFGDILLYLAGRFFGRTALRYPPLKWMIEADDIARTSRWFTAKGPIIILTSRFLPGSRLPTYLSAGILGTSFWLFTLYFSVAAALWTPLLVGMAAVVGSQMLVYYEQFRQYSIGILLGTVFCLWLLVKLVIPLFSFRGRRLLLSSFRRKIHYEFWPTPVFYIPVVWYILYLSMRHRSLTMFTASNPGIPAGGLVGESKSQILDSFQTEREVIARYRLINFSLSLNEKVSQAVHFMSEIETSFPIVLKPDAGERGASVAIIKSKDELENYLANVESDTIVQEYIEGYEYGVFYYRYPGQRKGHIFTITDKRRLELVGDGRSNLETLILKDDRAVCKAPLHLKVHEKNLFEVPGKGEEVKLVEVGAHARGALFLDGNYAWTPELEAAIDKTSKGFKGFYFGRYDIRAPSIEDFRKGKNFKIVELNGVTSEATDIYDPKNSIWHAYKVLMKQWKIAFEIGALNVKRGQKTVPLIKFLGLLFRS
jgi:membrane protein DedA with SNARE-associated domain